MLIFSDKVKWILDNVPGGKRAGLPEKGELLFGTVEHG